MLGLTFFPYFYGRVKIEETTVGPGTDHVCRQSYGGDFSSLRLMWIPGTPLRGYRESRDKFRASTTTTDSSGKTVVTKISQMA